MAKQNDSLNFTQPDNQLSAIANAERSKLFPRNDYSPSSESYSAQHPDAMSDGDDLGRGTSSFLDIHNQKVGTKTDVQEREMEVKVNRFSKDNPYFVVTDTGPNQKPMSNL